MAYHSGMFHDFNHTRMGAPGENDRPFTRFLQIHRSYVVNTGHISRLAKNGRDYKVVLGRVEVKLPVSRFRFKDLRLQSTLAGVG